MSTTNETDYIENLPFPIPYVFLASGSNYVMLYTSAKFYRTVFNTNIAINLGVGNNYAAGLWYSLDGLLPANTFNSTKPITEVSFPNDNSVQINAPMTFYHSIEIDFKLTKNLAGDGYQNFRKIQCLPVRADGITPYDNSIIGYKQPGPNNRDTMYIQGDLTHAAGDIIKLRFNVLQDAGHSDQSDTTLTIYRITWNMAGLKKI